MLIDTHTHLEAMEDVPGVMARAAEAGVTAVIAMGMGDASCRRTLAIAGDYGSAAVYPALGIHPWNLETEDPEPAMAFIAANIQKAVAVGEIGLDYWLKWARKDPEGRRRQQSVFADLLDLARRHDLPVSVHTRGAWEDAFEMADRRVDRAVFHWYSGPIAVLKKILDRGYLISATPAAEYSRQHQDAIAATPLERLMLETDSPVRYNHQMAEPAMIQTPLSAVARIKSVPEAEVARITSRNAIRFFRLPQPA